MAVSSSAPTIAIPPTLPPAAAVAEATADSTAAAVAEATADSTAAAPAAAGAPTVAQATIALTIDGKTLTTEVVATNQGREGGLMYRDSLAEDGAMLFVFPSDQPLSFWMRNTRIPLAVAFLSADGTILNIEQMQPLDETNIHSSAGQARYALETNPGWFTANGITAGMRAVFTLPEGLEVN